MGELASEKCYSASFHFALTGHSISRRERPLIWIASKDLTLFAVASYWGRPEYEDTT